MKGSERGEQCRHSAVGSRFPNEVSGTRSITLDLFLSSPYLRQTFTLFTTLLRARSGQLSFIEWSHLTMTPPFWQHWGRCDVRPQARGEAALRTHTWHTFVSMTIDIYFLLTVTCSCISFNLLLWTHVRIIKYWLLIIHLLITNTKS